LPGQVVAYTLVYTNHGPALARDVVLSDTLPAELGNISPSPAASAVDGRTYSWSLGDLASGASGSVTIDATVDTSLSVDAILTNDASITSIDDTSDGNNHAQVAISVEVPRVAFEQATTIAAEDSGNVSINVTLSIANPYADTTVRYATSDDSATASADYTAASGTLTIPAGETSATFAVAILEDELSEPTEQLQLDLSDPQGAALGTPASATLSITDVSTPDGTYYTYLPLVSAPPRPGPDLVVESFSLSPNQQTFAAGSPVVVTVQIANRGETPTPSGFWVDMFINPNVVPSADLVPLAWYDHCTMDPCYGITWEVPQSLEPGEQLTLTSEPGGFHETYSRWPGWFASGTSELYIYIDGWGDPGEPGAVIESNEENNMAVLRNLQVGGTTPPTTTLQEGGFPPRPARPGED
jgi:uncharacterized repeat protein (TIGR01451 family)